MSDTVAVPKQEYELLKRKADLFDHYVETEELDAAELHIIQNALKGPFLSKTAFLKKHPEVT